MEWVKTTAKTVPQAIELALDNLGVDESEAEIVVIEEPRTGLFGRVKGAARVEARIKPVTVRPKADRRNRRGDRKGGNRGKRGNNNRRDNRGDRGGRNRSGSGSGGKNGKGGGRDRSNNRSDNRQNNQNRQNNGQGDNRNRSQGRSQGDGGGRRRGGKGNGQGRQSSETAVKESANAEVTENTAVDQAADHTNEPVNAQAFAGAGTDNAAGGVAENETGSGSSGGRRRGSRGRGRGRGANGNSNTGGATAAAAAASVNGSDDPSDDATGESQQSNRNRSRAGSKRAKEETPVEHVDDEVVADHLKEFLGGLTTAFGLDGDVNIETPEPEVMVATVAGQHGLMVGPKGRTLDAIQELARVSTQRSAPSGVRIRVDVGGYRQQRSEAIASFAMKAADKAVDNGVEVKLDPMPASDRKSVHDALTEDDRVETRSIGAEPRRRVLIVPLASNGGEEEE